MHITRSTRHLGVVTPLKNVEKRNGELPTGRNEVNPQRIGLHLIRHLHIYAELAHTITHQPKESAISHHAMRMTSEPVWTDLATS